jgi:hypothetical protein
LASGQKLKVESVEILEGRFRVRVEKDGTSAFVELPFGRFSPKQVLSIVDRHSEKGNAQQKLKSAQIALGLGLTAEARGRFEEAVQLDPTLRADSDAGLAAVEGQEATSQFKDLEASLRKSKDPSVELAELKALLTGPFAGVLSPAQRLRIKMLIHLAKTMVERAAERAAKKAAKDAGAPDKKPKADKDDDPPPPQRSGAVPAPRTYADERYRARRGGRPARPNVPGANRPPSAASGRPSGAGGRSTGGGGGAGGGSAGRGLGR